MPVELTERSGLSEDQQEFLWTLNFGPQHPATHTTLRLILTLDGETVVKAVPDIGYLHSGFEKLGEDLDFNQYVTIVDRMNYMSPLANEIAWHQSVEKLMGIELTPRCKYIRTMLNELARISDHLLCVGAVALDLGAFTAFLYGFYQRELLYDIFEAIAGQRYHPSYTRVGGLLCDLSDGAIAKIRSLRQGLPQDARRPVPAAQPQPHLRGSARAASACCSKEQAINLSCTGPIARASGVVRDLRKDEPYLAYKDLDFKVICAREGDCYARYLVRMEEMLESLKIVTAVIENLPAGPVNVDVNGKAVFPEQKNVYRNIESMIQHFELVMPNRQWTPPVDEVYAAIESPNGELGFYVVSDGTGVGLSGPAPGRRRSSTSRCFRT